MTARKRPTRPPGIAGIYDISPTGVWLPHAFTHNSRKVESGFSAARLFGFGDRSYKINRMYVEFENVADPSDPVAVPSYDAYDLRSYYDNLSGTRDFLRIPLEGDPQLSIASGYADYFEDGATGNSLLFRAVTQGSVGMNGLTYSNGANSKVYGLALVAAPVDADKTQDVLICRAYFEVADQKLKAASGENGLSWAIVFAPNE